MIGVYFQCQRGIFKFQSTWRFRLFNRGNFSIIKAEFSVFRFCIGKALGNIAEGLEVDREGFFLISEIVNYPLYLKQSDGSQYQTQQYSKKLPFLP